MYYESYGGALNTKLSAPLDEKFIEAVVNRILLNRGNGNTGILPEAAPYEPVYKQPLVENIAFVDDIEALSMDGIKAVAGAMEMFRKK